MEFCNKNSFWLKAANYFWGHNQEFFRTGEASKYKVTSINISSATHERKAPKEKILTRNEKFNP